MIRKAFYLTGEQIRSLKLLPGNTSDHVRRAIDAYLEKKLPKITFSPTRRD